MTRPRQKARAFGLRAESVAALWLRLRFYRILARNFAASGGEIDLIAQRGETIVFVEVKARPSLDEALIALDAGKARRISRAARAWLAAHPGFSGLNYRCDGIFIAPWRLPRHVQAAAPLELFL
jgi:putative endonuclease